MLYCTFCLLLQDLTFAPNCSHLNKHLDACYSLEGQQQKGHERQPLALRRLLETVDDCSKLHVVLPEDTQNYWSKNVYKSRNKCSCSKNMDRVRKMRKVVSGFVSVLKK